MTRNDFGKAVYVRVWFKTLRRPQIEKVSFQQEVPFQCDKT